jgi:hypothetical protein
MHAVAHGELGEHALDVGLHGRPAEHELRGDLAVGQTTRDQLEHLALARRQRLQRCAGDARRRRGARELLDQALGDRRRDQRLARGERVDRCDQLLGQDIFQQEAARARAQRLRRA